MFVFLSYRKNFAEAQDELAMVHESSVFELLRFDCFYFIFTALTSITFPPYLFLALSTQRESFLFFCFPGEVSTHDTVALLLQ